MVGQEPPSDCINHLQGAAGGTAVPGVSAGISCGLCLGLNNSNSPRHKHETMSTRVTQLSVVLPVWWQQAQHCSVICQHTAPHCKAATRHKYAAPAVAQQPIHLTHALTAALQHAHHMLLLPSGDDALANTSRLLRGQAPDTPPQTGVPRLTALDCGNGYQPGT